MATTPELDVIVANVERIRTRLYMVRLMERLTVALTVAAAVSVPILVTRGVYPRRPVECYVFLVPVIVAVALWFTTGPRTKRFQRWPATLAILACLLTLAFALVMHLPAFRALPLWSIAVACASVFALAALATTRKVSRQAAAIFVDQQAGLKEKVSTALEWQKAQPNSPLEAAFRQPLITSAVEACHNVRKAKVGYRKMDRRNYIIAATCIAAAVYVASRTPLTALARVSKDENPQVAKNLADLEMAIKQIQKEHPIKVETNVPAETQRQIETMQQQGDLSTMETLSKLRGIEKDLEGELNRQDANEKTEKVLAGTDQDSLKQVAEAAKQLEQAIAKGAQGEAGAQDAKAEAEQKLASAAQAAADKLAKGQMTPQEKQDLGKALDKAIAQAGNDPALKQQLQQAKDALDKNDAKGMQQSMQAAGQQMGQQMANQQLSSDEIKKTISALQNSQDGLTNQEKMAQGGNQGDQNKGDNPEKQPGGGNDQANGGQDQQPGGGDQQPGGGDKQSGGGDDQANGQQPGQGQQPGAGQQPGDGQQPGQGAGQSPGSALAQGDGSTERKQEGAPGSHNQDGTVGGTRNHTDLYGANAINSAGATEKEKLALGAGQSAGSVDQWALGKKTAQTVQNQAQKAAAEHQAMQQIDQQQIPPQYHDLVRGFYHNQDATPQK